MKSVTVIRWQQLESIEFSQIYNYEVHVKDACKEDAQKLLLPLFSVPGISLSCKTLCDFWFNCFNTSEATMKIIIDPFYIYYK